MTLKRSRTTGHPIRKSLVLLACLAPLCGLVWASPSDDVPAYSVNLSVIDEKNQPVPEAMVEVRFNGDLIATSTTSPAGKATLPLKAAGSYSLTIKKQGYLPAETTCEVSKASTAQEVDVVLSSAALSQQTVEVKGEPSSPVLESSSTQTTLPTTQAKNTALKPATLADALPLVPGIVRAKDGSVRIAGLGESHSALLVNSVDVTDPCHRQLRPQRAHR